MGARYDDQIFPDRLATPDARVRLHVLADGADVIDFDSLFITSGLAGVVRNVAPWERVTVKVALTRPDAIMPQYAHEGDSGMDLATPIDLLLEPGIPCFVDLGVAIELPPGFEGQIRSRSGLTKKGITACSGIGTVDNSYRGSLGVTLLWHAAGDNIHSATWKLEAGTRIAQLVIAPVARAEIHACKSVDELTPTTRGTGGFGSTG